MTIHTESRNQLLARLPEDDFHRLYARMQLTKLEAGQVLSKAGAPVDCVYFPDRAIISAITIRENGGSHEVTTIGREGMVGLGALSAESISSCELIVQVGGDALRLDTDALEQEASLDSSLRRLLRLYHAAFRAQIAYSAVCNMLHSVEQRCCRWLLTTCDRLETNELPLGHEFLASMLQLRRTSVPDVLRPLSKQKLIRNRRESLVIADRSGLDRLACGCYRGVRDAFDRLLR
ncbi:MAG TPA: Crp/Fnr family transcriptional regulator [Pirellulales bacterium]|nr:Crp/Fnr family transcriptional regulator [Pirellulales bacterium]